MWSKKLTRRISHLRLDFAHRRRLDLTILAVDDLVHRQHTSRLPARAAAPDWPRLVSVRAMYAGPRADDARALFVLVGLGPAVTFAATSGDRSLRTWLRSSIGSPSTRQRGRTLSRARKSLLT